MLNLILIDALLENGMQQEMNHLLDEYESGHISRRTLIAMLGAVMLSHAASAASSAEGFSAKSLNHVSLAVSDLDRSQKFYEQVLGASVVSTQPNGVNMGLGDGFLGLYKIDPPSRIHHFCVGIDDYDVNEAADRLRRLGLDPYVREDKPEVYFEDPDGISVQLESKDYRG